MSICFGSHNLTCDQIQDLRRWVEENDDAPRWMPQDSVVIIDPATATITYEAYCIRGTEHRDAAIPGGVGFCFTAGGEAATQTRHVPITKPYPASIAPLIHREYL